jgi:hypothetical protein
MQRARPDIALLNLRVVKHAMPSLIDRISVSEAEALSAMGEHKAACAAYARVPCLCSRSLDRLCELARSRA